MFIGKSISENIGTIYRNRDTGVTVEVKLLDTTATLQRSFF